MSIIQRVLDYAANPDKTEYDALAQTLHYAENDAKTTLDESAQLVTSIHCRVDHAWEDTSSALTLTESTRRSGQEMVAEQFVFIGWEKNTTLQP